MINNAYITKALEHNDVDYALNILYSYATESYDRILSIDNDITKQGYVLLSTPGAISKSNNYAECLRKQLLKYGYKCKYSPLSYLELETVFKDIFGGLEDEKLFEHDLQ